MTLLTAEQYNPSIANYLPIHQLLAKKNTLAWRYAWHGIENAQDSLVQFYPNYVAALIKAIAAVKAKRVFILHPDRAYFLAGFLAALQLGIPVVLPPSGAPGFLIELMEPDDCLLSNQAELSNTVPLFIATDRIAFVAEAEPTFSAVDPKTSSVIFYTSGSTGHPKQVKKTLIQLEAEIAVLRNTWGDTCNLFIATVSQQHIYGLLFSLLWPICSGYPLKRPTFAFWEGLLACCDVATTIVSSPSHLGRFPLINASIPNIKRVFSSSSLLSFEAAQKTLQLLGTLPIEIYGSTETGGIAYRQQQQSTTPWQCFPVVKIKTEVDQTLCIQSPYLPEQQFYTTQDQVFLVGSDQFHLIGRTDSVVKIEGKRISLVAVEQKLNRLPHIQEVAVIMLPNKNREELGAIAVLSPYGKNRLLAIGKAKLVREVRENLKNYFDLMLIPKKWRFVPNIPINPQGKKPIAVLQALFEEEKF